MINKLLTLLVIIFFLTLLLSVKHSRKGLWQRNNTRNSRLYTFRAYIVLALIVLFLFFSLFR
ncbi:hypothetical protein ACLI08_04610 [Flavobacterium sp. RNTU_13]|uniref:hypothetical protein n=1 Tax=Flavobacterium sp. RNTU_13 TaxID=3375145 RepID=UPI003986A9DD